MKKIIFLISILILTVFLVQNQAFAKWGKKPKKPHIDINYTDENSVFAPINLVGENRIYVGTFQLVWNYLQDEIIKAPIQFTGEKSYLADVLNKQGFRKEMLSENSYYINSGKTTLNLKKEIEKGIYEKFREKSDILNSINWNNPDSILIYAMLKKDFEFLTEFDNIENSKFLDEKVKFFGIKKGANLDLRSNVGVLFYNNKNDFALKIKTKSDDEVILYRTDDNECFEKYYQDLNSKITDDSRLKNFTKDDSMKVPYIKFDKTFNYKELTNKPIEKTDFIISDAIQTVKFEMNNKGVKLKSEAGVVVALTAIPQKKTILREFNFDKPFTLFLIEKDKNTPYFAIRFEDSKLFIK